MHIMSYYLNVTHTEGMCTHTDVSLCVYIYVYIYIELYDIQKEVYI